MNVISGLKKFLLLSLAIITLFTATVMQRIPVRAESGNLIIMLDPGHGGIDGGAENTVDGVYYNENNLMLKVANYTKAELSQYPGVTVLLTRENTGTTLTLAERVSKATANGAHAIVSIHANSFSGEGAKGAEALVACGNYRPEIANATKSLGNKILSQLQSIGLNNRGNKTRLDNQDEVIAYYPDGSLQDYYGIVQRALRAGIPGIIIETAFISNSSDVRNHFSSDAKLERLGKAIATGIAQHYGLSKSTTASAAQKPHIDARSLTFTGQPDTSFLYPLNGTKVAQSSGFATLTQGSDGIKTYIDYRGMSFSADTYKYAVIRMRSSSENATATINTGAHKIIYDAAAFTYKTTLGTDFQNVVIDMSGNNDWTLAVNFIKIQISGTTMADVEYIKFYDSKAAIENGENASKPSAVPTTAPTSVPTTKPTPPPTKEPDMMPTNTVAPVNTSEPATPTVSASDPVSTPDNKPEITDNIESSPIVPEITPESNTAGKKDDKKDYTLIIVLCILLTLALAANVIIILMNKRQEKE